MSKPASKANRTHEGVLINSGVPTWDIRSAKKSTGALWVKLEGSLYESRCGRLRVQKVKTGQGVADVSFLSYVNIPGFGWRHVLPDHSSLSDAILGCEEAVKKGVFDEEVNH